MTTFEIVSGIADMVVGIVSLGLATLATALTLRQWRAERHEREVAGAKAAVDRLFTEELAEVRYSLYDHLNEVAAAARGRLTPAENGRLRRDFDVHPRSAQIMSRYRLSRRWSRLPPENEVHEERRAEFLRLSSVLGASFDAVFKAAADSPAAAKYVQERVGRLIVWWLLVWPGLFDHSHAFMGREFVSGPRVRDCPPSGGRSVGYTAKFVEQPLWTQTDWEGAIANYRALQKTMMPGDQWCGSMLTLDTSASIFGAAGDPLDYPSDRPDDPYVILGDQALKVDWDWDLRAVRTEDGRRLSTVLAERGAAPLEERVVQIAFGANRDLTNLAWKFANYRREDGEPVSGDLVVLPGVIDQADVVACNIGYWGYVYGALLLNRPGLVSRPELSTAAAPVSVLLLDNEQMRAMHKSEGVPRSQGAAREDVSCDVAMESVRALGRSLDAQLYALPLPFLSFDGSQSVPFARVATTGVPGVRRFSQDEMWSGIVDGLRDSVPGLSGALGPDVADRLKAGARSRMEGGQGSGDAHQSLYEAMREGLIDVLPLGGADPITGSDCVDPLPHDQAWSFGPLLGQQLPTPGSTTRA